MIFLGNYVRCGGQNQAPVWGRYTFAEALQETPPAVTDREGVRVQAFLVDSDGTLLAADSPPIHGKRSWYITPGGWMRLIQEAQAFLAADSQRQELRTMKGAAVASEAAP